MTNDHNIWVFIEQEDQHIAEVSLELLGKGAEISKQLGSEVWAVLCGTQVDALAEQVIQDGADQVLLAEDPELEIYRTLPYCRVITNLARQWQPYIFLIGASPVAQRQARR